MCCVLTVMAFIGPRAASVVWWILDPSRWDHAFSTVFWPILGLLFLPWTTLMYVIVEPGGVHGFEWVWMAFAVFLDLAFSSGSIYGNRGRTSRYATA